MNVRTGQLSFADSAACHPEPVPPDPAAAGSPAPVRLTPEQEEAAARRRGPLLVAAGAGSGKTAVLVERYVRAVREDGVAPGRILAITFTERAAGELRERVRARLLALGARDAARDLEGAPIGTFHGFCARLLRVHALAAGLDPDFAILDEAGATRLADLAFRHALAALLAGPRREEAVELLAAYGPDRLRGMVWGVYVEQRSRGVSLPLLPPVASPEPAQRDAVRACAVLGEVLRELGHRYAELKRARAALDFDDLELCARELLAREEGVRRAWAERLELLMVDEFQDTNRRQLALLELLERDNLFTVGDELQSIYRFRHAEVELFRERRRRLQTQGRALALVHNFRARPPLLAAVTAVFAPRFGDAGGVLVAARPPAAVEPGSFATDKCPPAAVELLLTDRGAWSRCGDRPGPAGGASAVGEGSTPAPTLAQRVAGALPPAPLWRHAEARLVAQRVTDLVAGGHAAAGDVAVLLRAAGDLPVYERALEECGLATLAAVGAFWGHPQVGDLLMWLRALANPLDEVALYSVLASPLVGLSADGLALVALHARAAGVSAWAACAEACPPDPDGARLARFAEHFAAERRVAATHPLAELVVRALAHADYVRHVLALPWGERRMANVHKLVRLARRYEAAEGRDLRGFLDHAAHRALAETSEPHAPVGSEPDAVRLLTVHAAKGLEFPVVCLADLGRAPGGGPPDLLVDGERVGLRLARLDGSQPAPCLEYEDLWAERRRAETAEEDRILYVGMTRARERLLVSGACDFERWPVAPPPGAVSDSPGARGTPGGGPPIAWLAAALAPGVPALARTLERPIADLAVAGGGGEIRCWLNAPATVGQVLRADSTPGPWAADPRPPS